MVLLRDYLLAADQEQGNGVARRSSAWLLLDLLRHGIAANDETAVRRAFYNRKLPDGSSYTTASRTLDRWRAFQANEFCHIACEALFNGLLAELQDDPFGADPRIVTVKLLERILSALELGDQTWEEWATRAGSEFTENEEALAARVLASFSDLQQASSADALSGALHLIATLWFRWGGDDSSVRETIQHYAGSGGRSLAGILRSLDAQAAQPVAQAMHDVIRRHLISDHLGKHRKIRLLALASGRILRSGGTEGRGDAAAG
jgi:hypothetical protein